MLTYAELKTAERAILWPSPGEPRNLRTAHDRFFDEAMIEISQWVDCLQVNNTTVHPACSGFVHCAKSVFPAPNGLIKRVYTLANDDRWCDRVDYLSKRFIDVDQFARNLQLWWTAPEQGDLPPLPQGFQHPSRTSNSICGRARTGIWAINRHKLYVAPWLETNESLVVEWDGPKTDWKDVDMVDDGRWAIDARTVVRLYVKWRHEAEYGCNEQKIKRLREEYAKGLADLMHWCREYTKEQLDETSSVEPRYPSVAEIQDSAVPAEVDETVVFAQIGDFGKPTESGGAGVLGVSELVKSWNPNFILTTGDNIYAPTVTYELAVGAYYDDYITGNSNTNRFWPIIGNHDHNDPTGGINDYYAYFNLPGNRRYYELVRGPVHFFMLHSGLNNLGAVSPEVDGIEVTSIQALWLKAKLALSPARWKVVLVHDSPYNLGADYPGHTILRWPFKDWGADVVMSGDVHRYERYEVGGFPFIVNGLGGATRDNPNPDVAGTLTALIKSSYNADWGAVKGTATCDSLKFEFTTRSGLLIDTLELTKE